eukprot:Phypoly_transcript_00818.p1 GENE.Phypoly_transcript_00818~~Phypoly_transcript_00818.p1  ORF type:complete len:1263 (+),score=126.45 Phypoly_transcript_00818:119-3907(+)
MTKSQSLLILFLSVNALLVVADVQYVQGVLRDQGPDTMKQCGSAGTANNSYGFVGTDFQLPIGYYRDNEKGLVGKECNDQNGWGPTECGRINTFDRTPIYAYKGRSPGKNIQSPDSFQKWFHASPETIDVIFSVPLTNNGRGVYGYTNFSFFPLDNIGWQDHCNDAGNPPKPHNYAYCFEAHFRFGYQGGERFDFTGDDDVWVYINDYLVIDLGSLHQKMSESVELDKLNIGLVKSTPTVSSSYKFDFFYCERHTTESNMQISTSLVAYCAYYDWCNVCEGNGQSCCTADIIAQHCDDGNLCTTDLCSVRDSPDVSCQHIKVNCTAPDKCNNADCDPATGTCKTTPVSCDDNDACTIDSCSPTLGCQHTLNSCNDNNKCTVDSCNKVTGCSNVAISCNDNNQCTADTCNPSSGCSNTAISCPDSRCFPGSCNPNSGCTNTTLNCNDNDVCTLDSCDSMNGGCQHVKTNCDDNNKCTIDTCDPVNGCQHDTFSCDDHNDCTTDGCDPSSNCTHVPVVCEEKLCQTVQCLTSGGCTYAPVTCNDNNKCTIDTCDASNGQCSNQKINCDDGSACTDDSCDLNTGKCVNAPHTCNDNSKCTVDTCNNATGCVFTQISCDDKNACTTDSCAPSSGCAHVNISCDDGQKCTIDTCSPSFGCSNTPVNCKTGDACIIGTCDPNTGSCKNTSIPDCTKCTAPKVVDCSGFGDKCHPYVCTPVNGSCVPDTPVSCNDNSKCTTDSCDLSTGQCSFVPINCTDTDPCTVDSCVAATGCVNTPMDCDDKSVCTKDSCAAGQCQNTLLPCAPDNKCQLANCDKTNGCLKTNKTCDDGNPCTSDSCSLTTGECIFTAIAKFCIPCASTTCTWSDSCHPSVCDNSTNTCKPNPVVCNDNSLCTDDSCDGSGTTYKCNYVKKNCTTTTPCNPASCDPKIGCTLLNFTCDDGNLCTKDSCVVVNNNASCQFDTIPCTSPDLCHLHACNSSTGECLVTPKVCNDGNPCTIDSCELDGNCSFVYKNCTTDPCNPMTCDDSGECVAVPVSCDDGNPCTTDIVNCTADTNGPQCVHIINETVCDDGKYCTVDICNSSVPAGENPCQNVPMECPVLDQCTLSNNCSEESRGCAPVLKDCAMNHTNDNTSDYCILSKCDPNAGCIFEPRICPNQDIGCYDAVCNNVTRQCEQKQKSNFNKNTGKGGILCVLLYNKKARAAAITGGALAGIIIGAIIAAALIGVGGKVGYTYLMAKNAPMSNVGTNPLYADAAGSGTNALFEGPQ